MFNPLIYVFLCWWCSERKHSFILYQEFRLCYYRTVNLHTDKTRLGRMKYKASSSRRYVKDTIRILSVLHGSTRTPSEASFFFFLPGWKTSKRRRGIFFSHWEVLAALLVVKFAVNAGRAACWPDKHAPTSTHRCRRVTRIPLSLSLDSAAFKRKIIPNQFLSISTFKLTTLHISI